MSHHRNDSNLAITLHITLCTLHFNSVKMQKEEGEEETSSVESGHMIEFIVFTYLLYFLISNFNT